MCILCEDVSTLCDNSQPVKSFIQSMFENRNFHEETRCRTLKQYKKKMKLRWFCKMKEKRKRAKLKSAFIFLIILFNMKKELFLWI